MNLDNIAKNIEIQEKLRRERINTITEDESFYQYDYVNPSVEKVFSEPNTPKIHEITTFEKMQSLETPNTRRNRLAALAEQQKSWEDETMIHSYSKKYDSPTLSSPNPAKISSSEITSDRNNLENTSPNIRMDFKSSNEICKSLFAPACKLENEKISANEITTNSGRKDKVQTSTNSIVVQSEKKIIANSNILIKTSNQFEKKKEFSTVTAPQNKFKNDQLDFSIDEPTRKPVSERLNAWKNKVESTTPTTVTKQVNSFEKKIFLANKTKTTSPSWQPIKSPQYNNVRNETKWQNTGSNSKKTNGELIPATITCLTRKSSSTKTNINKFSPKNVNIVSSNVIRTSPKTSFNLTDKIVKNLPKIETTNGSHIAESISVTGVDKIESTMDKERKNSPVCKTTNVKKEKMREDFESKLKAMGFDVDEESKCAVNLPLMLPEKKELEILQENKLDLLPTTPKVANTFSAGKTPPAKNSLYTLLRKSDQVGININNNSLPKLTEPRQVNIEYSESNNNKEYFVAKKNNFLDSFDSVDSDDVQPNSNVIKSAVKFGSTTVKEYVPTTDTDTTNDNIDSDTEQSNLDSEEDEDNDLNKNIDSNNSLLSSSEHDDEKSEGDDDERQVVEKLDLSDLLDKEEMEPSEASNKICQTLLADSRLARINEQISLVNLHDGKEVDNKSLVVMRKKSSVARRRSSLESVKKPRGYISIQEYRRQTRPKSQPPQNRNHNHLTQNHQSLSTIAIQDNTNCKRLYPVLPTEDNIEKRKKYRLRLCVDATALRSWIVH